MSLEAVAEEVEPSQIVEASEAPPPPPVDVMDPEKQRKAEERAAKAQAARIARKLKAAKSVDDLDKLYTKLRGKPAPKVEAEDRPTLAVVQPPAVSAAEVQARAQDAAQAAALEKAGEMLETVADAAQEAVDGTPFELTDKKKKLVTMLCTPYLMTGGPALNPSTLAIVGVGLWVGPPLVSMAVGLYREYREEQKALKA